MADFSNIGAYTRTPPDLSTTSADYWQGVHDAETEIMNMLGIPIEGES